MSTSASVSSPSCPTHIVFPLWVQLELLEVSVESWSPRKHIQDNKTMRGVNVSLHPDTKSFSLGVGFDPPPRCFPLSRRANRTQRCSPQGSPRCSATSYQNGALKLFGALRDQSGFRSHSWGLATLSDHKRLLTLEDE